MNTHSHPKLLSSERIASYLTYLRQQERSEKTIQKYAHDLTSCAVSLSGCEITRERLIAWKESLIQTHSSSSVNAALAAVNGFLAFFHWHDLKIKPLKIQRQLFCDAERELSRSEYLRLVGAVYRSFVSLQPKLSAQGGRKWPARESGAPFFCRKNLESR